MSRDTTDQVTIDELLELLRTLYECGDIKEVHRAIEAFGLERIGY